MDIFENLENLPISEECFNEIMDIVEAILEGKEPFETTMDYKQRLQKHFGPILNDKMATQKSIAKHYNKKAKGLGKEVKKAEGERDTADKEENKAREKWDNSWKIANAMGDVYGYDSDIYKETKEGKDKASKKLEKAENNTKKAWKKLDDIKGKKYDAEDSANTAKDKQEEINNKIWRTGTTYYRHK